MQWKCNSHHKSVHVTDDYVNTPILMYCLTTHLLLTLDTNTWTIFIDPIIPYCLTCHVTLTSCRWPVNLRSGTSVGVLMSFWRIRRSRLPDDKTSAFQARAPVTQQNGFKSDHSKSHDKHTIAYLCLLCSAINLQHMHLHPLQRKTH